MKHCNPRDFIESVDKEYQSLKKELRLRHINIIHNYLKDTGIIFNIQKYNWVWYAEQMEIWALWEASSLDCKQRVLERFSDYLNPDDKEFIKAVWEWGVYEYFTDIISDELWINY